MNKIKTGDGSFTFHNLDFDEVYHSVSGAEEEAVEKYAKPTNVAKLAKEKGKVKILDFCFGFGYNSAALIDAALEANPNCKIEIIGLEIDKSLLDLVAELAPKFKNYHIIRKLKELDGVYKKGNVSLKVLYGDAIKRIHELEDDYFDICVFDPFSPRKHPEMWTEEVFKSIAKKMKYAGVLSTYSCATKVRINLVRAGFDPKDGPCIGRRSPSTIAKKIFA